MNKLNPDIMARFYALCDEANPETKGKEMRVYELVSALGLTYEQENELTGAITAWVSEAADAAFIVGWECCAEPRHLVFDFGIFEVGKGAS